MDRVPFLADDAPFRDFELPCDFPVFSPVNILPDGDRTYVTHSSVALRNMCTCLTNK
jgi:hypothetical protein